VRKKNGPKSKLICRHISAFPSHFPIQFNFHSNSFSFSVRFGFCSFLTRTGRTRSSPSPCSSLRRRRADRIRPPPPSNLRIPTPPSFKPLVLSDLPNVFPLSVVPCSLLPNSRVLGIMVSSVWDCNARAACNLI